MSNIKIYLICKVCYKEMDVKFVTDKINYEISNAIVLFVEPCKHCAAQQTPTLDGDGRCAVCGLEKINLLDCHK